MSSRTQPLQQPGQPGYRDSPVQLSLDGSVYSAADLYDVEYSRNDHPAIRLGLFNAPKLPLGVLFRHCRDDQQDFPDYDKHLSDGDFTIGLQRLSHLTFKLTKRISQTRSKLNKRHRMTTEVQP